MNSFIIRTQKKSNFLFITFAISIAVMTIFEVSKEPLFGNLSLWESHWITVVFSSILATLFASHTFDAIRKFERNQAQELHRADQEKLTSIFEMSPLGMFSNTMTGYYLEANQAFLDIVGYSNEELITLNCKDITPKEYLHQEKALHELLMTQGNYGPYEKEYIHKDGHLIPVRLSGVLLTDKSGLQSICSIVEDVTKAKLNAESSKLAEMVFDHTSEAIFIMDDNDAVISINPAFIKITGYTKEEIISKNFHTLGFNYLEESSFHSMTQAISIVGQWQGEMKLQHKNQDSYSVWLTAKTIYNDDNSVHHRVLIFSDITQRKASEEIILQQANFDSLTGLPNRRLFHDRLAQEIKRATRSNKQLALIFLDLDHFKEINDTLGHDMGDILLKEAAQRLKASIRDADTVARLGGDEFILILSDLHSVESVERVVQVLLQKMSQPFQLDDKTVYVSASLGITFFPKDATKAYDLLKHADQAMYDAKNKGRNRSSYFTSSMQNLAKARILIINDLRTALAENQFVLYYQPIVDLSNGQINKVEALIRWFHPLRGMVSPIEFIPIAEEFGLIHEIGNWVFQDAAKQLVKLKDLYGAEFQISINKSPAQFHTIGHSQNNWVEYLKQLGLPKKSLVVEITESLLMNDNSYTVKKLIELHEAGVELSVDDFGTGYSSLSYLKKYDIDYLKIDRSFVTNLQEGSDDSIICEAIIVMAHKLGIKVIAEGVETIEQRDILIDSGCDFGQGYLFSKPLPIEELIDFIGNTPY